MFSKRGKKAMKLIFGIVGVLVVGSMIMFYAPGILALI